MHYQESMQETLTGIGRGKTRSIRMKGKTTRDHKSGAWDRCWRNKAERASWQNDSKRPPFSSIAHTCNGKRNRNPNADTI